MMKQKNSQTADRLHLILRMAVGSIWGVVFAAGGYWVSQRLDQLKEAWLCVTLGACFGAIVGLFWPVFSSLAMRLRSEEWQVTEIEFDTLGQKWKLASSGSQRRVAWALFVEIVTRIATWPMSDDAGDDGAALKSLHDLFQTTRKAITEMEPTRILPSRNKMFGDTVETYALSMLNIDIRPFLSKWHPLWDAWKSENGEAHCRSWEQHTAFRAELRDLQTKMQERAKGLGEIAEVSEISRFVS